MNLLSSGDDDGKTVAMTTTATSPTVTRLFFLFLYNIFIWCFTHAIRFLDYFGSRLFFHYTALCVFNTVIGWRTHAHVTLFRPCSYRAIALWESIHSACTHIRICTFYFWFCNCKSAAVFDAFGIWHFTYAHQKMCAFLDVIATPADSATSAQTTTTMVRCTRCYCRHRHCHFHHHKWMEINK